MNNKNPKVEEVITAIGDVIEISMFVLTKMVKEGFSYDEAFKTAQEFILRSLNVGGSNEQE